MDADAAKSAAEREEEKATEKEREAQSDKVATDDSFLTLTLCRIVSDDRLPVAASLASFRA